MARSERYIPLSEKELERLRRAREAAEQCDRDRLDLFRRTLGNAKKADIIEVALRMAVEEKACEWLLENELDLEKPVHLLVNDIGVAIDIATKVDELRHNYNFSYDSRAYEAICRGLKKLIQKNEIDEAKTIALTLMKKASHQISCSDEGLMKDEIESCLLPVILAVADSPAGGQWALEMLACDWSSCLCTKELIEISKQVRKIFA